MRPRRIELASQDPRRLVAYPNSGRHHDIVIRKRKLRAMQAKALANLPLEPVSLNAVHAGFNGNAKPRPGADSGKPKKSTHAEALHLATLEKLQVFRAEADPCGFGKIHPCSASESLRSDGRNQALAALRTALVEDFLSVSRSHTGAETVGLRSLFTGRLVSAFHTSDSFGQNLLSVSCTEATATCQPSYPPGHCQGAEFMLTLLLSRFSQELLDESAKPLGQHL